eukprot:UN13006
MSLFYFSYIYCAKAAIRQIFVIGMFLICLPFTETKWLIKSARSKISIFSIAGISLLHRGQHSKIRCAASSALGSHLFLYNASSLPFVATLIWPTKILTFGIAIISNENNRCDLDLDFEINCRRYDPANVLGMK